MSLFSWGNFLKDILATRRRTAPLGRKNRARLDLELLEDRTLLSKVNWINPNGGDWDTASNWSNGQVPGAGDDVVVSTPGITVTHATFASDSVNSLTSEANLNISLGTLSIASASTIDGAFTLSNQGTLAGAGTLTLNGASTWSGGTMSGSGSTVVATAARLQIGGPTGNHDELLDTRTLSNAGTATFVGSPNLTAFDQSNGSVFDNLAGATLIIGASFQWSNDQTSATLNNEGTIIKSGDPGTTVVEPAFNNSGSVQIQAGTLSLQGGGDETGGFSVAAGSTLGVDGSGAFTLAGSSTMAGAGAVEVGGFVTVTLASGIAWTAGLTNIDGGTVTLGSGAAVSVANLNLSSGIVDGPGTLTLTGQATWSGGTMSGGGSTVVATGASLQIGGRAGEHDESLDARTLSNAGAVTFLGAPPLLTAFNQSDGSAFDNLAGATLTLGTSLQWLDDGTACILSNQGTVVLSDPAGTTTVGPAFDNTGLVEVAAGTLALSGGTFSGAATFNVAAGATVNLAAATIVTYSGTLSGSGAGAVLLSAGDLQAGLGGLTFNFAGALFQWTGGLINAQSGDVTNDGTINIAGSDQETADGTFDDLGTLIQSGSGVLVLSSASTLPAALTIESGGQYLLESDSGVTTAGPGTYAIDNYGVVRKTAGTGVSTLSLAALDNGGVIEADSGTLNLHAASIVQLSAGTLSAGTWNALDGATLEFPSGVAANQASIALGGAGATISGLSNLASNGGSFSLTGGADFTAAGGFTNSGRLTVGAGSTLTVDGDFTQTTGATLNAQIGGTPASGQFGQVVVTNTATLAGAFNLTLTNGYAPQIGQVFPVMSYAGVAGTFTSETGLKSIFTAAYNPTGLDLTASANAVDLALDAVRAPTAAPAGQQITVSWQATDQSGQAAAGGWQDSVYLSATPGITSSSTLIGTEHQGGLGAGASYDASWSGGAPALPPGSYYVVVQIDSLFQVPDPNRDNNILDAGNLLTLSLPALTPGRPLSDSFTGADEDRYYQVTVPAGGTLVVSLSSSASSGATALYLSQGALPTPYSAQQSATADQPSQTVAVPQVLAAGTYYILAHSVSGAAATAGYTLTVTQDSALSVSAISSYAGGNGGDVTVEIDGANLTPAATASLSLGAAVVNAAAIDFVSARQLFATFDLTGMAAGSYTLKVQQGAQSAPAPTTFQVVAAPSPPPLQVVLATPQLIRSGRTGAIVVSYTNPTDNDMVAPLLNIASTNTSVFFSTPDDPNNYTQDAQVLAVAPSGPAGILRPGQSGQLTLTLLSDDTFGDDQIPVTVSQIISGQSINWASQESTLQPSTIPTAAWNVIFNNVLATVGSTTGSYNAALAQAATYLGGLGESTAQVSDVSHLWSFLVSQADAEFPTTTLTSTFDAALSTPGGPALALDRTFVSSIAGRYTPGIFGLGWTTSWQTSLRVDASGNVTIDSGGALGFFVHQANGSYLDIDGEYGTLRLSGSAYTFTDTSGDQFAFLPSGLLNYEQDTNGNRITLGYNAQNQLVSLTYSNRADSAEPTEQLTLTYNAQGFVSQAADGTGDVWNYAYDPAGHLLSVTAPGNLTTAYTYDTGGNPETTNALLSITNPDGSQANFTYDAQGRLSGASQNGGADPIAFAYPDEAEVKATDAAGDQTTVWFNDLGLASRVEDPRGAVTGYLYDANGNLIGATDAVGNTYQFSYDANGNVTQTVNPLGQTLNLTYDALSDLTSITDAADNTTQYNYNSAGNLRSIAYPDGTQQSFSYDPLGNLSETVEQNGDPVGYQCNAQGLVTQESFADGSSQTFAYDAHGNLLTAKTFASGGALTGTTTLKYNAANELTSIAYPNGQFLNFTYNAQGQRSRSVDQSGFTVNYSYDALGRLSELTDGSNNLIVQYTYNNLDQLVKKVNGNGTYTTYGYDMAGNLTSEINYLSGTTVNSSFTYTYNLLGEETSVTDNAGNKTSYGYDAAGQLTQVTLPGGQTITYVYNAAGDRTEVVNNGAPTSYASNADNEITQVGSTTYTYDANGNLHTMTDASGTTTYTYNDLNQLTSIAAPDGSTTTFQYSPLGFLVGMTTTANGVSSQTNYVVDPTGLGNVTASYNGSGSLIADYTYGLGLVSQTGPSGTGYYDFDGSGNTVGITGSSGTYVNQYSYLPFGETTTVKATLPNPFTFGGQFGEMQIGDNLFYLRARNYTPVTGQFLSNDPIGLSGGDVNVRRFVGNSPTNAADPLGLGDAPWVVQSKLIQALQKKGGILAIENTTGRGVLINIQTILKAGPATQNPAVKQALENGLKSLKVIKDLDHLEHFFHVSFFIIFDILDAGYRIYDYNHNPDSEFHYIHLDHPGPTLIPTLPKLIKILLNVLSADPNALLGPTGYGTEGFIQPAGALPYTVDFENDGSAAAQDVTVTEQLDPNLNWSTFQFGAFSFGLVQVAVPAGLTDYQTTIPYQNSDGSPLNVLVNLDFNVQTGLLTATFTSLDPADGQAPAGVFDGFLPPNDSSNVGQGYLQYTVQPKAGLTTGTAINQQAAVVFDTNAAIDTKTVTNTIDAVAPTSSVAALPPIESSPSFTVSWAGTDDTGGSGIASYTIYVSDDGGPFTPFLTATTQTSATFTSVIGHTYGFYSVATDNVGNVQATPAAAQTTTTVTLPPEFVYNPTAQTLAITLTAALPNFTFSQATTANGGTTSTVYTFTLSGSSAPSVTETFTASQLTTSPASGGAAVTVVGQGLAGTAILITNDTYLDQSGQKQETPERIALGSLTDDGTGTISKFVGNNLNNAEYTFLSLEGFPLSYAYAGRNDGTIQLFGTENTGKVGFVTAGYYSYIASAVTGVYAHFGEGTPEVIGTGAGNASDFAYHYTSSAPSTVSTITSVFTVNGIASSSMAGGQTNPEDNGNVDTFDNIANGFVLNTAVSYTGNSIAYINDSPLSDTYVAQATDPLGLGSIGGVAGFSYMYVGAFPNFNEFDVAYGFGTYYASSTMGGHDIDYPGAPANNVFSGSWIQSFS